MPQYTKRQISRAIERAADRLGSSRILADFLGVHESEISRAITCRTSEEHDVPATIQWSIGLEHGVLDYYRCEIPIDERLAELAPSGIIVVNSLTPGVRRVRKEAA